MTKKTGIIVIVISIIAIVMSAAALITAGNAVKQEGSDTSEVQYVMYLGTNDKDTNEPVCSQDEAKEKAEEILLDMFGGYTIVEANGGWIDEDKKYQEYTLVIYLSDTFEDQVHEAADKLLEEFNQSSILIHANETRMEYYSGDQQ